MRILFPNSAATRAVEEEPAFGPGGGERKKVGARAKAAQAAAEEWKVGAGMHTSRRCAVQKPAGSLQKVRLSEVASWMTCFSCPEVLGVPKGTQAA